MYSTALLISSLLNPLFNIVSILLPCPAVLGYAFLPTSSWLLEKGNSSGVPSSSVQHYVQKLAWTSPQLPASCGKWSTAMLGRSSHMQSMQQKDANKNEYFRKWNHFSNLSFLFPDVFTWTNFQSFSFLQFDHFRRSLLTLPNCFSLLMGFSHYGSWGQTHHCS